MSKAESDAESGSLHIHLYAGVYTELNAGLEKFPLFGLSQSSLSAKSLGSRSASNIRCNKASTVRYPGKKKKETQTESEDSISQSNCYFPVHIFTTIIHTCRNLLLKALELRRELPESSDLLFDAILNISFCLFVVRDWLFPKSLSIVSMASTRLSCNFSLNNKTTETLQGTIVYY